MATVADGLTYHGACRCAGTGCGGHLELPATGPGKVVLTYAGCKCAGLYCGGHELPGAIQFTPIGWQGAAQHTYTTACDGLHAPGPCPSCRVPAGERIGLVHTD